jgi:hypothetical protein
MARTMGAPWKMRFSLFRAGHEFLTDVALSFRRPTVEHPLSGFVWICPPITSGPAGGNAREPHGSRPRPKGLTPLIARQPNRPSLLGSGPAPTACSERPRCWRTTAGNGRNSGRCWANHRPSADSGLTIFECTVTVSVPSSLFGRPAAVELYQPRTREVGGIVEADAAICPATRVAADGRICAS